MAGIYFTDIDVSADGWIRCNVTRETTEELRIQLPYSFLPAPDLIAIAFSTLCGNKFDQVEIDLPIGPRLSETLQNVLDAKLIHRAGADVRRRPGNQSALNFSGGFDSLAAKVLLPEAHLISLDFAGRFTRERASFEKFNPFILKTNLISLGLNKYSWAFMGIGTILMRDELHLGSYSFGSIQAGSLPKLFSSPVNQNRFRIAAADGLNMTIANPVAGISEIGAVDLVLRYFPLAVSDVLLSVAAPGEDKFRRKSQMLQSLAATRGASLGIPTGIQSTPAVSWGEEFARDLASLYVLKTLGADVVASTYLGGIPDSVTKHLPSLTMDFMTRFNPQAYEGVELSALSRWYSTLTVSGILPYERKDWFEIASVMKLLRGEM